MVGVALRVHVNRTPIMLDLLAVQYANHDLFNAAIGVIASNEVMEIGNNIVSNMDGSVLVLYLICEKSNNPYFETSRGSGGHPPPLKMTLLVSTLVLW